MLPNIKSFHPIKWLYEIIWRKARTIPYGPILPTKHLNKWKQSSLLLAQYQKLLSYWHMVQNKKTMKNRLGHFSFAPAYLKSIKICENIVAYLYNNIKYFYHIDTCNGTKRQWKRGQGISPWVYPSSKTLGNWKNTLAYLYHNIKNIHPIKWLYEIIWRKARTIPLWLYPSYKTLE